MNEAIVLPGHSVVHWLIALAFAAALGRDARLSRFLRWTATLGAFLGLMAWLEVSGYAGTAARLGAIALLALSRRRSKPPVSLPTLAVRAAAALACSSMIEHAAPVRFLFAALALHSGFRLIFGEDSGRARTLIGEIRFVAELFALSPEAFVVFCGLAAAGRDDRDSGREERISIGIALALVGLAPLVESWAPRIPSEGLLVLVALVLAIGRFSRETAKITANER